MKYKIYCINCKCLIGTSNTLMKVLCPVCLLDKLEIKVK